MNQTMPMLRRFFCAVALCFAFGAQSACAINVWMPDSMGFTPNTEIRIPIYTASVTGQQVFSFYTRVTFDSSVLTCLGATKTGCISSSWPNPTVNTGTPGEVTVAMYGTSALAGSGRLIYLRFQVVGSNGQGTPLAFSFFNYNEGTPPATSTNGSVYIGNPAPLMEPLSDVSVNETELVQFTVTAHDPGGESVTLTASSLPAGATFTNLGPGSSRFSWQTNYQSAGVHHPVFTVTDAIGQTASRTANITVNNVSLPPVVVNPIPDVTVAEGFAPYTINTAGVFQDIESDGLVLSLSDDNQGLASSLVNGIITLSAEQDWNGVATVTLTAFDGTYSVPDIFQVTVTPVNDAPVALAQSVTTAEDTPLAITLSGTDVDGDALTYTVVNGPNHGIYQSGIYTPTANYFGSDAIVFHCSDGQLTSNDATVQITVTSVNDAPVIDLPATFSFAEDGALPVDFTPYLSDIDSQNLTLTVSGNSQVHVAISGFTVTFSAAANWHGTETLTFSVNDNAQRLVASDQVAVTVTSVNDAPMAAAQSVTTAEDTPLAITLTGTDVDGDALTYTIMSGPNHGIYQSGVYTPTANYFGPDAIVFHCSDGQLTSNDATVQITVTSVNDAPVAAAQSVTTAEDTPLAITLTGSDVDGDALSYTVLSGPSHGTYLSGVYTPTANYFGPDALVFHCSDGQLTSNDATVQITVTSVNDAPVALAQSVTTVEDTPLAITLTGTDVDGDVLSYTVVSGPSHGIYLSGVYTPTANYFGPDAIVFHCSDGQLTSNDANVQITVTSVNDAPAIDLPATFSFAEDGSLPVDFTPYLSDIDSQTLTLSVTGNSQVLANISGFAVIFSATANWHGTETLTFTVNDNAQRLLATDQVEVTVTSVNDAPIALDQVLATQEDQSLVITLLGTDVDGDSLSFTVISGPSHGVFADGIYTPTQDYSGLDNVVYNCSDGQLTSNDATVQITVTAVNDAPLIDLPAVFSFPEDSTLAVDFGPFLSDIDSQNLTLTVSGNQHVQVGISGFAVQFGAQADWNGNELLTFTVNDNSQRLVASDQIEILVTPVNDAPVAADMNVVTPEDEALAIGLLGSDVDGDQLTYSILAGPFHGLFADGVYTPGVNFNGLDSLIYSCSDGIVSSNQAIVGITVSSIDDPTIVQLCNDMPECGSSVEMMNSSFTICLNLADVDSDSVQVRILIDDQEELVNWAVADSPFFHVLDDIPMDTNQICVEISASEFVCGCWNLDFTSVNPLGIPTEYHLAQNYPNPFNPSTTIEFGLKKTDIVKISIYDLNGHLVDVIKDDLMPAGNFSTVWTPKNRASGIYVIRFVAGEFHEERKMCYLK